MDHKQFIELMRPLSRAAVPILLAMFVWRNIRAGRNSIGSVILPDAYFSEGDAQTHCDVIYANTSTQRLAFCEDAVFWDAPTDHGEAKRRVLISCDNNRLQWNTVMGPLLNSSGHGAIWVHDLKSQEPPVPVDIENFPPNADFHPLGISVLSRRFTTDTDSSRLLVVNHRRHNTTIEEFSLSTSPPYKAIHIRTFSHPEFISPNAVAWTSPTSFYLTQDHRFTRRLPGIWGRVLPMVETLLLPGGN